ncbi:hypothetical protein GQ43DRAFT_359806, partial [Delitschia confertaspora ATCC 74209]
FVLQVDNPRIYTSHATQDWLRDKRVSAYRLSSYSPDLNPIEHMWKFSEVR